MALSNIFREPKRELIEQAFGFLPLAACGVATYALASWWAGIAPGEWRGVPFTVYLLLALVVVLIGTLVAIGGMFLMHSIGEAICNSMARHGHDPRPKVRP